jgi:hypothetical protein
MKLADMLNMLAQLNVYSRVTSIGSTQCLCVGDVATLFYDEQGYFLSGYVQESDYSV